ncbi:efflux RND transporter permease subunit [Dokdonella sp.]|uniref:efflux RND transporter permease subunit n=1 Tax=Dokdonella sp. TaxID=2291710 RepID=UPI003527B134
MLQEMLRRGTLTTVVALIVCVLGISAALRIPVQMIPDLEVRTIRVETQWPGATPQDVEKEILIEQERFLRTLPNLTRMVAFAETGRASIELEFPFGVDINEALIRTSNALSQVSGYPENVDPPRLYSSSFSNNAFMYFALSPLPGNPLDLDMDMVRDFVEDNVRPIMERVPGISQVDVGGGAERQVRIHVDPARLAQRGLSLTDVRDAVRARNSDTSAGDLDSDKRRYLIRTVGRFETIAELENLILVRRGDASVRLGDVAEVELDHYELRGIAFADGSPRMNLSVRRESGSNVIDIKNTLLPVVDDINRDLLRPNGLQMTLFGDDVRYVQASIRNVWTNLGIGALLATMVMLLFLRSARATMIAAIGLPICTIAAFLGLLAFGRTINVISLAGVAFAVGMTVDNTIVVLESIEQARRRGLDRFEAALQGTREVWTAVLASTMTTVLVFVPVLFVEEEAGQLYSDIAIALSASILASMLVAIGLIPTAAARLGLGVSEAPEPKQNRLAKRLLGIGDWFTASRMRASVCVGATLAATLFIVFELTPPAEYLPEGEEPKAFSRMIAPPGYNLTEMSRIATEIRAVLDPTVHASRDAFEAGKSPIPPLVGYSMWGSAGSLVVMSEPVDGGDIQAMMDGLTELFRSYPGMRAFSSRGSIISSNDGGTRAVALDISGPDMASLYTTAQAAMTRAQDLFDDPQLNSDPSSLSLDQPLIEVRPRWNLLAESGFSARDFGYSVSALSDGAYVDDFLLEDDQIDIFLYSGAGSDQTLTGLPQQPVLTPSGSIVPLSALADIIETVDSASLRRVDGRRTVTLYIIPSRNVALETAVQRVRTEMLPALREAGEVGEGVSIAISGAADQLDATREALGGNFLIAIILCYLLLVAIFSHWGYPLLILVTVPVGIAGGILGLHVLNGAGAMLGWLGLGTVTQSLDMITMLGFLILLGTVVNNPILIVDRTRENLRVAGTSVAEAVREAVRSRVRPIMMATLTTVFGLAPLVLIPGAGTELYRGVGVIVLAGLLCSSVVTLTFLPSLLTLTLRPQKVEADPAPSR